MTTNKGVVTLGALVGRIERLDIRCLRCPRHGRIRLTTLLDEHGPDLSLPELAQRLAAGCPKIDAPDLGERCFVHYPQLLKLDEASAASSRLARSCSRLPRRPVSAAAVASRSARSAAPALRPVSRTAQAAEGAIGVAREPASH